MIVTALPNQPLQEHILNVVRETGWVLGGPKGAAARLAMKRSTLRWKMKRLGISRPTSSAPASSNPTFGTGAV